MVRLISNLPSLRGFWGFWGFWFCPTACWRSIRWSMAPAIYWLGSYAFLALERFLKESGVPEPEARHIRLAEKLVFSDDPSAQADLPGGITIARRYDLLEAAGGAETFQPVRICCPGEVSIPALGLKVVCQPAREVLDGPDAFTVDTQGPAILRPRQAGDRICLSGGSKSLKKLFIDRKIPAHLRPLVPVLCDDAGVLGVPGIGVSRDRRGRLWTFRFIKEENILTESRGYHG